MRVFETRTATRREDFVCQDSGVSQIFTLIISNGEKILNNVNKQVKRENIQKFGFINGVDNVNWPPYRDSKS